PSRPTPIPISSPPGTWSTSIWAGKWMLSIIQDGKAVVTDIIEWIKKILGKKPKDSDHGYCVLCRERKLLVKSAPYDRSRVDLPDDQIIEGAVLTLQQKMTEMGISYDWDTFPLTYIKRDFELKDGIGNILRTPYACSRCFFTIYDDFIGKRENGQGITHVNIIGSRDTGKSCLVASIFHKYDEMMIADTPDQRYFDDMWQKIIKDNKAPEATLGNVRLSPVLTIRVGSHYVCMQDLAGEHNNIKVAAGAVKKNDVVAVLVDIGNPVTINEALGVLTLIERGNASKVVICITKIDKYKDFDCMSPVAREKEFRNNIISTVYNSSVSKKIRQKIMIWSDNPEKRTKRFLEKLKDDNNFMAMYRRAEVCSQNPVAIVAHAGLGVGTDSDYTLQGYYSSMYIEETVETFIS
ncbi:MAG: GTPase domain-containing protein, partial [Clostridia bacterium]|nr:GTPase domain-containing protein [Clostridia bacterium]